MSERPLKVRLKTKKNRTVSQKRWLERQLNDPYVARAKREGFRGRAAFKLIEIDDRHHLLKKGARVVDLGAAPGGWSQVAAKRVGAGQAGNTGKVVGIDLLDMPAIAGVESVRLDFLDPDAPDEDKPGWVVDGQQRCAAIRESRVGAFPICVTAFITESDAEQRSQFILVNSTKPLPKGLIHELLPSTVGALPTALRSAPRCMRRP